MYQVLSNCKTAGEAIEASSLHVGQLMRITELQVSGNTDGMWTVWIAGLEPAATSENPYQECGTQEEIICG